MNTDFFGRRLGPEGGLVFWLCGRRLALGNGLDLSDLICGGVQPLRYRYRRRARFLSRLEMELNFYRPRSAVGIADR